MTKEEKIEAYKMKLDGKSYREIGDAFGISKQAAQQSLNIGSSCVLRAPQKIIYPAIARYMIDNQMNFHTMAAHTGVSASGLRHFLIGGGGSKYVIDKILELTELTYEEAFRERDK